MNAAAFYQLFNCEFERVRELLPSLKRASARTSKWRLPLKEGSVLLAFATNSKSAGLIPHMPGEFRLMATWSHGRGPARKEEYVSYFQYTSDAEAAEYAHLQRQALEKFLRQPEKEQLRSIFSYSSDPDWTPRANIQEWNYYFDSEDALAWGRWYRQTLPGWIERFSAAPESHDAWCWRVLWPHLKREGACGLTTHQSEEA